MAEKKMGEFSSCCLLLVESIRERRETRTSAVSIRTTKAALYRIIGVREGQFALDTLQKISVDDCDKWCHPLRI
jgi:hypothetical protein